MYRVFEDATPLVEGLSIDEAFLDVRGMERIAGTPVEIAARLKRDVLDQVGLPVTVGVARTKFLAKVASGVAKPDGLLIVPPEPTATIKASGTAGPKTITATTSKHANVSGNATLTQFSPANSTTLVLTPSHWTSRVSMRPSGPVPVTWARSSPCSRASCRAAGEASRRVGDWMIG